MTCGADAAGMLASLVALVTLCLSLRRPRGKHHKGRDRRESASAYPDEGHDAHLPGGIVDQELHEPEIAELGHPPGWVAGPCRPAEQAVVRVFADAGENLHQKIEPLSGQAPHRGQPR